MVSRLPASLSQSKSSDALLDDCTQKSDHCGIKSLSSTRTDEELQKSLQDHFEKFGRLYIKIRRDGNGNPYSFCQFEVSY